MNHLSDPTWMYIGLGGNLGSEHELRERFRSAVTAIAALDYVETVCVSSLYRTSPWGPVSVQPTFLNAVVACGGELRPMPLQILADLQALERRFGRDRRTGVAMGPRTLDLDLLLVGRACHAIEAPLRLHIPHSGIASRRFVLEPLAELLGAQTTIPGTTVTLADALAEEAVQAQIIERIATLDWLNE